MPDTQVSKEDALAAIKEQQEAKGEQGQAQTPQDTHPMATGPKGDPDANPKVPTGDDEATVGTPGSAAESVKANQEAVAAALDDEGKGYLGHNPDPLPNEAYTQPVQGALIDQQPTVRPKDAPNGEKGSKGKANGGDGQAATQEATA